MQLLLGNTTGHADLGTGVVVSLERLGPGWRRTSTCRHALVIQTALGVNLSFPGGSLPSSHVAAWLAEHVSQAMVSSGFLYLFAASACR